MSSLTHTRTHIQVLELWTSACNAIEKREFFLSKLETFEREASDPSRFFARGIAQTNMQVMFAVCIALSSQFSRSFLGMMEFL